MKDRIEFLKQSVEILTIIRRVLLVFEKLKNTRFLTSELVNSLQLSDFCLQTLGGALWLETGWKMVNRAQFDEWIGESVVFKKVWKRVDFMKIVDEFILEKKRFDFALKRLKEKSGVVSKKYKERISDFGEGALDHVCWCIEKEANEVLEMKKPEKKRDKDGEQRFLEKMEDFFLNEIEGRMDRSNIWDYFNEFPTEEYEMLENEAMSSRDEFDFEVEKIGRFGVFDWERFRRIWKELKKLVPRIEEFEETQMRKYKTKIVSRESYPLFAKISTINAIIE